MRCIRWALLAAVAACGADPKSSASNTSSVPAAKDSIKAKAAASARADSLRIAALKDPAKKDSVRKATQDSAVHLAESSQPQHRTYADSFSLVDAIRAGLRHPGWPVRGPEALPHSLLPSKRVVAFYGNPLSKRMGVLGEYPQPEMLAKLDTAVAEWNQADPSTPVQPALHLVASVAQSAPGDDGMHRQRSHPELIEKVYGWAKSKNAILFLDIQAGKSTLEEEMPRLLPFLSRPDVHLGLDPEFYMHYNREGRAPGSKIGAMDAKDINYAIDQLAALVTKYNLPPKILVVHRFTTNMLQNASQIKLDPRVQVVINMDGWGQPWLKFDTYKKCEVQEPVQFTGFKLFFHNDTRKGDKLLSPAEVLSLRPRPVYIQYQ
ncbi:MAG TPA: hypothetical protein VIP11_24510 [Gemmatimonadaceae bacterium]